MNGIIYFVIFAKIYLFLFYMVNHYYKKQYVDLDVKETVARILEENQIDINVTMGQRISPYYDAENKEIHINDKNTIRTLTEAFHEIGHAIYEVNLSDNFNGLLFLIQKYSIVIAFFCFVLSSYTISPWVIYTGLAFSLLSVYFFITLLKEEILASLYGSILFKTHVSQTRLLSQIRLCMNIALSTYLFLMGISLFISGRFIFFILK